MYNTRRSVHLTPVSPKTERPEDGGGGYQQTRFDVRSRDMSCWVIENISMSHKQETFAKYVSVDPIPPSLDTCLVGGGRYFLTGNWTAREQYTEAPLYVRDT